MDHDVGLLADLDRTDPVGHPDRFRAADRGQLEHLMGAEPGRGEAGVAGQPGRQRRGPEDVERVARVGRVAAQCHAAPALDDLRVTAVRRDSLPEAQVRPRAVGDRGGGVEDQLDLAIVEPHAVADEQMTAEHAQIGEVFHRAPSGPFEVSLRVRRRRREVHRHTGAEFAGEVGRAGEQFVRGEIVADEGDPTLDQASARWIPSDHGPLTGEHLRRRRRERPVVDVPPPHTDRGADTGRIEGDGDAVDVGDRAGLHQRRHAVRQRLDGRQCGRDLVVVREMRVVQWDRPLEDRFAGRQQVGDAASHQRIAGEVLVGVDHPGRDHTVAGVDDRGARMVGRES